MSRFSTRIAFAPISAAKARAATAAGSSPRAHRTRFGMTEAACCRTQGGRDIPSKRGVSVTCRWKSAATSGGTTTSRNSDDNSLACPMRQRFNRTGVWATTITAQNALSRCLLQQLLHFRPIVGRRLAGRSGAEIGRGLAVFGRKRFREGLDGTGCREHHFVRLVNGVRSANECASVGRTGIAGDDHALRLFEGKVERKEHVRD